MEAKRAPPKSTIAYILLYHGLILPIFAFHQQAESHKLCRSRDNHLTGIALGVSHSSSATYTIASERKYGSEGERLCVRPSALQNRLESMGLVLFDVGKFASGPGPHPDADPD